MGRTVIQHNIVQNDEVEFIRPYNARNYIVHNQNQIYFKRYNRNGITTYECCSSKFCGGRLLWINGNHFKASTGHGKFCHGNIVKVQQVRFKARIYEMCTDRQTQRTFVDIYNVAAQMYPSAAHTTNKNSIMKTMLRWRYQFTERLPQTLTELDHLMNDPNVYHEYGRNTFGTYNINDVDYRFYDKLISVPLHNDDGQVIDSKIMCFKIPTVINHVKGKMVNLAGDGTENLHPKSKVSYKYTFDSVKQLYVVHVILHKKVNIAVHPTTVICCRVNFFCIINFGCFISSFHLIFPNTYL